MLVGLLLLLYCLIRVTGSYHSCKINDEDDEDVYVVRGVAVLSTVNYNNDCGTCINDLSACCLVSRKSRSVVDERVSVAGRGSD